MKRRWKLLVVLFLLALVVGGVLVAQSPRARVRWLEFRARSSDRKVREEARWALFYTWPAVEADDLLELIAEEARDVRETCPGLYLCVGRYAGGEWSSGKTVSLYTAKALAGPCPETFRDPYPQRFAYPDDLRFPVLVLGARVTSNPPPVGDSIERAVLIDEDLAKKIEKLAAH
jgi:hypothetical protein